ncbi:MAG: hypothetical protein GDA67_16710 [Nitrospira sp. CR1.3]|nr:hypothetical protein [Nitrospira sp. CR1.3]
MSTAVSQDVTVGVVIDTLTKSVNFQVNMLLQLGLHLVKERGLSPTYIIKHRTTLEAGLFTWLTEQSMLGFSYEIYDPANQVALERFDIAFAYSNEPDSKVRPLDRQRISEVCRKLTTLPPGTEYRVIVQTAPGAAVVEGWEPTEYLPLGDSVDIEIGEHGYGNIGAKLIYRGRIQQQEI